MSLAYKQRFHGINLAYWTGSKDICPKVERLTKKARQQYLERIFDTFKNGLWLTAPEELLYGSEGISLRYKAPFVSFTEVRAANIAQHACRYGLLGFVFSRDFVVERGGGPVFYVNKDDWRVTRLDSIRKVIEVFADADQLSIDGHEAPIKTKENLKTLKNIIDHFICQVKYMHSSEKNYLNYEECEWRLPHTDSVANKGLLKKANFPDATKEPQYYLSFSMTDLRFLVVPDNAVREMFLDDGRCSEENFVGISKLNILTLEEYGQI